MLLKQGFSFLSNLNHDRLSSPTAARILGPPPRGLPCLYNVCQRTHRLHRRSTPNATRTHTRTRACVCVWVCACYLRFSFFIIHCKESSSSILEGFSFLLFYLLHCFAFFQSLSLSVFLFWAEVFLVALCMCVYCVCSYLIFVAFLVK